MITVESKTKQIFLGEAYYLCGNYFQRNGVRLHRRVWEHFNGPIPEGFHVHHKDGDRTNNKLSNLELLQEHKHLSLHSSTPEAKANAKRAIDIARPYAVEWHKSPEARVLCSIWAKEGAKKVKPVTRVCQQCGVTFSTKGRHAKFCSNRCKSAYRRKMGLDDVKRTCEICGSEFEVNKYDDATCCSRACAGKKQSRTKSAAGWT